MEVKRILLSKLHTDPENARKHNGRNLAAIKESLVVNNQYAPLVVNRQGMIVVVGNGRFQAMKMLGWTECDCLVLDLNPQQMRRLSILDNRASELSEWDTAMLKDMVSGLEAYGVDAERLGFSEAELQKIYGIGNGRPERKPDKVGESFHCPKCGHQWQEFDHEVGVA